MQAEAPVERDGATGATVGPSAEDDGVLQDIQKDVGNFAEYERQFQAVLLSLENDDALEEFLAEYSGLHHSFLKSHESESRLLRKCVDLQSDIYTSVAKAHSAEELSRGDKHTIDVLKAEAERTSKKCAATRDRESMLRGKIDKLKLELAELYKLAHEPVEAAAQEASLQSLLRVHESVLKEKENQEHQVSALQYEIAAVERRLWKLRDGKTANDAELRAVQEAIERKQQEADGVADERRHKEELLKATREELAKRSSFVNESQARIQALREEEQHHQEEVRHTTEETSQLTDTYQTLSRQVQHTNTALQACNEDNDTLQRKVREAMTALQTQQTAVAASHKQYLKETALAEALQRRNVVAAQRVGEAEQQRDGLRDTLKQAAVELARQKALLDEEEGALEAVRKEQDVLHQDHLTAEGVTQRNIAWLAEKQAQLRHAEHALAASEEHAQAQNEAIYRTSKECMAAEEQMKTHALRCAALLGEIQSREQDIHTAQKDVAEVELKLRQHQEMLDGVLQTRNAAAKQHRELRHELSEMNKKFQLLIGQIEQVKDDLGRNERDVVAEDNVIGDLQRQRKDLEVYIVGLQRRVEKRGRTVDQFSSELLKLSEVLSSANEEVTRQRRRCREMLHERDLLGSKAVQRNRELGSLYEKLHVQQALLQRGEDMYRERVQHLDQLESQTAKLRLQLDSMQQFVARLPDLRVMINNASRELSKERVRVAALLSTSDQRLNVHAAHRLAWSEPAAFELATRVRELQRALTERRQKLDETEQRIQQTEQQYMKAKAAVAQQPGPEVAAQLSTYQASLVKKQAQMRQLQESLRYFREQTESYRSRHDDLRERLADMAKTYASRRQAEDRAEASAGWAAEAEAGATDRDDAGTNDGAEDEPLVYAGFVAPPMPTTP